MVHVVCSGKTYTMLGQVNEEELWGITPNAINHVFNHIEKCRENKDDNDYTVSVSFMEIYNEQVRDLLGSPGLFLFQF